MSAGGELKLKVYKYKIMQNKIVSEICFFKLAKRYDSKAAYALTSIMHKHVIVISLTIDVITAKY